LLRTGGRNDGERGCASNNLAPPHSMTSSAKARSDCGTVRPTVSTIMRPFPNRQPRNISPADLQRPSMKARPALGTSFPFPLAPAEVG
jgi:hypothetical protein